MKKEAFNLLLNMENSWWYKSRRLVVDKILSSKIKISNKNILDFGSGYGGMFGLLNKYGEVDAYEVEKECLDYCLNRGYRDVFSDINRVYSQEKHYSLIGMFDVLEHIENDRDTLIYMNRILDDKGSIILTVPAFMFLWSKHDEDHKHFRRYEKKEILKLFNECGFEVCYISYWNTFLFIPALILRLLGFSGSSSLGGDGFINNIFYLLVRVEAYIMKYISLPFGLSLVVLAKKKNEINQK